MADGVVVVGGSKVVQGVGAQGLPSLVLYDASGRMQDQGSSVKPSLLQRRHTTSGKIAWIEPHVSGSVAFFTFFAFLLWPHVGGGRLTSRAITKSLGETRRNGTLP